MLEEPLQGHQVLVGHLRRRQHRDLVGREAAQRVHHRGQRLVGERRQPGGRVDPAVAVAAFVADPPGVDVGVEARLEPRHPAALGVMRAATIHVHVDVAAARTAGADRLRGVEIPHAHLEAEVTISERADRADVDHVGRVVVFQIAPGKEPDLGVIAAVEDPELAGAGDLVAEPHAARAQNAPLGVEHHVGPERHRLRLVDLLVHHPRIVQAMLHVVDLQPALPRLIAHRTIQRMIDEMKLHHRPPRLLHSRRVGEHHHALSRHRIARDRRPRRLLEVDHAQPTLPRDGQRRMVAVVRHLDAQPPCGFDKIRAGLDLDLFPVDR